MTDFFSQTNRRRAGLILAVCGVALAGCYYGPPPAAMGAPPAGAEYGPSYAQAGPPVTGAEYNPGPGYQPSYQPSYQPGAGYAAPGGAAYPAAAAPAYGQPGGMRGGGRTLTRDEFIQRHVQHAQARGKDPQQAATRAARRFDKMDTDHNGVLEPAERMAWREAHPGRMHAAAGGGQGYQQAPGSMYQGPGAAQDPYSEQ